MTADMFCVCWMLTALPSVTLVRSDGSPLAAQLQTVYSGLVRAGSAVVLGPGTELDTEIIARATGNQALARCGDTAACGNMSAECDVVRYRDGMVMAADLEQVALFGGVVSVTQLTATYNSLPLHSRPLAQNYISNTLLRHLTPDTENKLGITVATHPLPEPKTVRATPSLYQCSIQWHYSNLSEPI